MRKNINNRTEQSVDNVNSYHEELESEITPTEVIFHEKNHRKPVLYGSILSIVLAIVFSMVSGTFVSEGKAEEVVANRVSHATMAGDSVFSDESNSGITPNDFSISLNDDGGSAKMLIWDFNKEDLDEVQVLVNGQPVKEKLILTHKAAAISIPVPSTVQVKGLKDNGGGISYAVKFPNNRDSYFNVLNVGGVNTYTVTIKP